MERFPGNFSFTASNVCLLFTRTYLNKNVIGVFHLVNGIIHSEYIVMRRVKVRLEAYKLNKKVCSSNESEKAVNLDLPADR